MPYIWDVIVGAITANTFEWARNSIKVFSLNREGAASSNDASEFEIAGMPETKTEGYDIHEHTPDVV